MVSLPFTEYSDMAEASTAAVPLVVITPSGEKLDIVTWTS